MSRQLEQVRTSLARYDQQRQRAAELRRDPAQLEDALAALQDAVRTWDTLQVRQEMDDCTLALQKRRELVMGAQHEVAVRVAESFVGRALKVLFLV